MQRSRAQKEYVEHSLAILKNYVLNGNVVFLYYPFKHSYEMYFSKSSLKKRNADT
ncbi:hypothetical protein GCM10008902_12310 [[Clostridium] innocuum]|nr:hypothetical protein CE91St51_05250 [[Clostridium] innocuum]